MTKTLRGICGGLLVLGLGAGSALAAAEADEEVTVAYPYTIRQQVLERSMSGDIKIVRASVEHQVSYSDLNLSREADLDVLRERLRQAAVQDCKELGRRYPRPLYNSVDDKNCVKETTARSMAKLDAILANGASAQVRKPGQRDR